MAISNLFDNKIKALAHRHKSIEISEPNPTLKKYYNSSETRLGYGLLLGGTKHHGWFEKDTKFPFPLIPSLRLAEDRLAATLNLPPDSRVLDAGCGDGSVALAMARWGHKVEGVDIIPRHVTAARAKVAAAGLEKSINIRQCSYQVLYPFTSESFDGVYAMESLPHSLNLSATLREFYRVLKPGGHFAAHDFDLGNSGKATSEEWKYNSFILNKLAGPSIYPAGVWQTMLEEAGFEDIIVKDITQHVYPMVRALGWLAFGPYIVNKTLGIEKHFPNTVLGVKNYQHIRRGVGWRFLSIEARKPLQSNPSKTSKEIAPSVSSAETASSKIIRIPEVWISCDERGDKDVVEVEHAYGEEWEIVETRDSQGKEVRVKIGVREVAGATPKL